MAPGVLVVAAAGCRQDVEVKADNTVIWGAPMGAHRLDPTPELAGYVHPTVPLTVDVSAADKDTELVFFPQDPEQSYTPFTVNSTALGARPETTAVGYVHRGGERTYNFGLGLYTMNLNQPQSLAAVYQRDHGECELEIAWDTVLAAVVEQVPSVTIDEKRVSLCKVSPYIPGCQEVIWRVDYESKTQVAVAGSYLRRNGMGAQGGFGLYVKAKVHFASPLIQDATAAGRITHDLVLGREMMEEEELGVPMVKPPAAPLVKVWCPKEGIYCPTEEVAPEIAAQLAEVTTKLNTALSECLAVPVETANPCTEPVDCSTSVEVMRMAVGAGLEAKSRGAPEDLQESLAAVVRDTSNWRCAPVTPTCAAILGTDPVPTPTCQLRLQATDIVAMPESFSLVWHQEGAGREPTTTGQALFLALTYGERSEDLTRLCSPLKTTNLDHRFAESRLEH